MATSKSLTKEEVVTINLKPFLVPASIVLSSIIIGLSLIIGLGNLGLNLKGSVTTSNTTADSTTDTSGNVAGTSASVTQDQIKSLFSNPAAITFGDPNSKLLLVEFSDTSCPYCHVAGGVDGALNTQIGSQFTMVADGGSYVAPVPEFKKLVDQGKAAFAYVYTTGHGNGKLGNQALFCANEKGKFWDAHDLLMNNDGYNLLNDTVQNDVNKASTLADFLSSAVDKSFMTDCLKSGKYSDQIAAGDQLASTFGVSGTPGFFVNTTEFAGAYSFTDMQSAVNSALGS